MPGTWYVVITVCWLDEWIINWLITVFVYVHLCLPLDIEFLEENIGLAEASLCI